LAETGKLSLDNSKIKNHQTRSGPKSDRGDDARSLNTSFYSVASSIKPA